MGDLQVVEEEGNTGGWETLAGNSEAMGCGRI